MVARGPALQKRVVKPSIFTDDFKERPYWWERTPRPDADADLNADMNAQAPPTSADVVIVGSGYTGLSAAIQTAGHGRHTVVVDAEEAGWGCSTRNGGQVSTSLKPGFPLLAKKFGENAALKILQEGSNALAWVEQFVGDYNIDCDYQKVGRFHGAHTPKAFGELQKKINEIPRALAIDARVVAPGEQHREIGSAFYHGGVVYPHHASIDPGRYHQGLLDCARAKGVEIVARCKVDAIKKISGPKTTSQTNGAFRITTAKGAITADEVVIATSGYTGGVTKWQQRRIIPVGSYVIATEPLPRETVARLIPHNRVITDTRKLVIYYRACPEGRRIIFGGRVSARESDLRTSALRLRAEMLRVFPELESVRISHSWMGFVGYTFDQMPHTGKRNGLYYSMGYCGSGISLASYFGMKTGLRVIGDPRGATALDGLPFPGRLWYRGRPWFLAPAVFYYRWRDRRDRP